MRPVRVQAKNFRSYETLDLAIPAGATAVTGANGTGKSTLLSIICDGLFAGRGEMAGHLRNGSDTVETTVTVEHDGELYRVRRGAGRKTTLDFERQVPGEGSRSGDPSESCTGSQSGLNDLGGSPTSLPGRVSWEPLSLASTADTQARINETLGLDAQTFKASAFLGQGDGSFAQSTPAKQHELFSRLLGLDVYERLCERARQDRRAAQADLDRLVAGLAEARDALTELPDAERATFAAGEAMETAQTAMHDATKSREQAEAAIAAVTEQKQAVDRARQALALAESEHRALAQVKDQAERARYDLIGTDTTLAELTARADALPSCEAEEERLRAAVEEHRRAVAAYEALCREQATAADRVADLERRAERIQKTATDMTMQAQRELDAETPACTHCGQPMGKTAVEQSVANLRATAQAMVDEGATLLRESRAIVIPAVGEPPSEPDYEPVRAATHAVAVARSAVYELAALTERLAGLRAKVDAAEDPKYVAALDAATAAQTTTREALASAMAGAANVDGPGLQRAALEAKATAAQAQHTLDQARVDKAQADQRLATLTTLKAKVDAAEPREHELQARIDVLAAAEAAHGRNGIPALILENRVGDIEQAATQILSELGGDTAGARVEIRTQRLKADGDTKDELQIVLVTADGHDRPFDAWSGGEQMRANVALRWALASSTGVEIVILDEPAALDDQGKTALRDIIDFLLGRGVKTVLVVSHEDGLRDSFEQVLEVVKDSGRSRVVGADREAVAA